MSHSMVVRQRRLAGWVALCLALLVAPATAEAPGPAETVDRLHVALLDVMRRADQLGFQGRASTLTPVVRESFDLDFMSRKSLGPHAAKLDEADRARWQETFLHFIVANYARQFDGYSGQTFETVGIETAPRGTQIVHTGLIRMNDEDVQLDYRLRPLTDGTSWKIIDVYSNGTVSELALRRSEFSSLYARKGFEALVTTVEEKAQSE